MSPTLRHIDSDILASLLSLILPSLQLPLGDFKGNIKEEKKSFDVLNISNNISSQWTVDIWNSSFDTCCLPEGAYATAGTRWSRSSGEMKKVPNKNVSERTPVLPFRDKNVREEKGQEDNQLKKDKTIKRIKGPTKVELSGGTAAEPANTPTSTCIARSVSSTIIV